MKTNKHANSPTIRLALALATAVAVAYTPLVNAASTLTINANLLAKSNFSITGSVAKGAGTFVIDHPLDPKNKLLYHSFVESPDVLNEYGGTVVLDAAGEVTITLPDYFEALNTDYTYQFFPLRGAMPNLYIKQPVRDNTFVIAGGSPGGSVSWMVTGVRQDPYILANPIVPEVEKGPDQLVDKGECIYEPLCE